MTLSRFQTLLKKIDPRLRVRVKGSGDVVGLFIGLAGRSGYICRLSKGELNARGFRHVFKDANNLGAQDVYNSKIQKRGRLTVINLLRNYRWVTNHKQRSMLAYGIDYPDNEVRGLTCKRGGSNVS